MARRKYLTEDEVREIIKEEIKDHHQRCCGHSDSTTTAWTKKTSEEKVDDLPPEIKETVDEWAKEAVEEMPEVKKMRAEYEKMLDRGNKPWWNWWS